MKITVHQVRSGATVYRVLRPARPLDRAVLFDGVHDLELYLDADAARRVGILWTLAARSRHSLIHLPLRGSRRPAGRPDLDHRTTLDLVLLQHTLQFAPAAWKDLRRRLGPGRVQTVALPSTDPPAEDEIDRSRNHRRENSDLLHEHLHAETVFLTGSTRVFRQTARRFHTLADVGASTPVGGSAPTHHCVELHGTEGTLGRHTRPVHVEYVARWTTPDRSSG